MDNIFASLLLLAMMSLAGWCVTFLVRHREELERGAVLRGYDVTGALLLMMALAWILHALALQDGWSADVPGAPHLRLPEPVRFGVWIVSGLVAFVSVFKPALRRAAYNLLWIMPTVRFLSLSWVCFTSLLAPAADLPGAVPADPMQAAYSAVKYLLMCGLVIVAALLTPLKETRRAT